MVFLFVMFTIERNKYNNMVIGIVAKKRSGKDTSADYLIEKYNFQKYWFADPLKRGAMAIFGFTEEQMYGDLKEVIDEEWGVTPRRVLQIMGTELFQHELPKHLPEFESVGRLIWVKRFMQWYKKKSEEANTGKSFDFNIVIADVRFQHEADAILALGGQVWKVNRPGLPNVDDHASEMELDNITGITHYIENDGTLQDLYNKIDANLNG